MKKIKFTIYGEPFGKLNMRPTVRGGHARSFNPKQNVEYMGRIIDVLDKTELVRFEKEEPISLLIIAYYKIPKDKYVYHKKTNTTDLTKQGQLMADHKLLPTKKPDLDNISKVVCDAITKQGGVWYDDSQITCELLMKYYDLVPRVEVTIEGGKKE